MFANLKNGFYSRAKILISLVYCLVVLPYAAGTSERKISFALGGEDEDSHHSSTTELNQEPPVAKEEEKKSKFNNIKMKGV